MILSRFVAGTVAATLLSVAAATAQFHDPLMPRPKEFGPLPVPPHRFNVWIPVGSDSLDATYYVPPNGPPDSTGYPAMILVHGFGGSKEWDTTTAALLAGSGYVALCYSVRGHGNSSGETTIMGPAERADLPIVLAFLRSLPVVNPKKIGVQGGSQGGLHALWAKADTLPVRAVSADVISPLWASSLLSNGSIRRTLTMLLNAPGVRYAAQRDTLWSLVRADDYKEMLRLFPAERDVDTAQLHTSTVPMIMFLKWRDHYFPAWDGIVSFLSQAPPARMYVGTGGHYTDNDPAELSYQWGEIGGWFNELLAGRSTGMSGRPPVSYAISSLPKTDKGWFTWKREASRTWPPSGITPMRLFFSPDSLLSFAPPSVHDSVVVRNRWDPSYSFEAALSDGFAGPGFEEGFPRDTHVFLTAPLSKDVAWVGLPRLHLVARPGTAAFPVHARIYEQDPAGRAVFVNRVNFTGREWRPGLVDTVTVEGLAHAHRFSRGSRIRVELTNIDVSDAEGWGEAPFVLPLFRRTETTVLTGGEAGSWIELPVTCTAGAFTDIMWFTAAVEESSRRVRVQWRTVAETAAVAFELERRDGESGEWAEVLGTPASGPGEYIFIDSTGRQGRRWYRLCQVENGGRTMYPETLRVDMSLVRVAELKPRGLVLDQNYPNPFNPSTTLRFSLPHRATAALSIYNVLGEKITRLADGVYPAGTYTVIWQTSRVSAGVYYARLSGEGASITRPMLLIR